MNFLEFVTAKAASCGWKVSDVLNDGLVALNFSADSGVEKVFIRPCGKNPDGNTVIEFTSGGLPVPSNPEIARELAFSLLRRNGDMMIGHWGIEELSGEEFFTVFATMLANTMDRDEFKAAVNAILSERRRFYKAMQSSLIDF